MVDPAAVRAIERVVQNNMMCLRLHCKNGLQKHQKIQRGGLRMRLIAWLDDVIIDR